MEIMITMTSIFCGSRRHMQGLQGHQACAGGLGQVGCSKPAQSDISLVLAFQSLCLM